jgi:hypothetical protein
VPLLRLGKVDQGERAARAWLMGAPAVYVAAYSYLEWHGGACLSMRYLLPILPFTSILTARLFEDLAAGRWGLPLGSAAAGGAIAAAALVGLGGSLPLEEQDPLLLVVPLVLAVALAVVFALASRPAPSGRRFRRSAVVLFVAALAWGGAATFLYDAPRDAGVRTEQRTIAGFFGRYVADDSLLIHQRITAFAGLHVARENMHLADASQGDYESSAAVARHYLAAGKRVYFNVMYADYEAHLEGKLEGLALVPLVNGKIRVARRAFGEVISLTPTDPPPRSSP